MYYKFNIVKKAMMKNGHGEKRYRKLMVGANRCVYYPCPLTSEPGI